MTPLKTQVLAERITTATSSSPRINSDGSISMEYLRSQGRSHSDPSPLIPAPPLRGQSLRWVHSAYESGCEPSEAVCWRAAARSWSMSARRRSTASISGDVSSPSRPHFRQVRPRQFSGPLASLIQFITTTPWTIDSSLPLEPPRRASQMGWFATFCSSRNRCPFPREP
jgi:hypothetical protein